MTELFSIINSNDIKKLKFLLSHNKDINLNYKNKYGISPLRTSILKDSSLDDRFKITKLLLSYDVDVNLTDNNGNTELIRAVLTSNSPLFKLLIKNDADVNISNKEGNTALMFTCKNGNLNLVNKLLENDANVNIKNKEGNNALMFACKNGNFDIVNKLLSNDAKVNEQNKMGNTALIIAANSNNLDIVKLLIANDANINIKNNENATALAFAIKNSNLKMTKLLTDNDAEVNNIHNKLPIDTEELLNSDKKKLIKELIDNKEYAKARKLLYHNDLSFTLDEMDKFNEKKLPSDITDLLKLYIHKIKTPHIPSVPFYKKNFMFGYDNLDYPKQLLQPQFKHIKQMDEKDKITLMHYIIETEHCITIKDELSFSNQNLNDTINKVTNIRKKIGKIFQKIPKILYPITVYYWIKNIENFPLDHTIHKVNYDSIYCFPIFINTNYNKNIALKEIHNKEKKEDWTLLSITIPSGARIIPIQNISVLKSELNILLPIDSKFFKTNEHITKDGIKVFDMNYIVPESKLISPYSSKYSFI